MEVVAEKPRPTRKLDMAKLPAQVRTRYERFWKICPPLVTKVDKKLPLKSDEFKAAFDDAMKGRDLSYKSANTPARLSKSSRTAIRKLTETLAGRLPQSSNLR